MSPIVLGGGGGSGVRTGGAPGTGGPGGPSGGGGVSGDVGPQDDGDGSAPGTGGAPGDTMDPDPIDTNMPPPPDAIVDVGGDASDGGTGLTSGLVGRWRLDEGAGATTADGSGSGNNGTISGAAWVNMGFPGAKYSNPAALAFDGKDAVMLGPRNLPANNRPQTVAFWLNYASVPTGNAQVCVALTDGNANGSRLKLGFKEQRLAAFKAAGTLVTAVPPAPGWHHFAYTYDGSMHRLFIDGAQKAMNGAAPDRGTVSNARLGANFDQSEPFTGVLDEVRIYNRPLSPAEIASLFAGEE